MKVGLILPMSDDDGRGAPSWPQIRDQARQRTATPATFAQVLDGIARSRPPRRALRP
jgi:hypothetical protein